jgi:predicted Zn-dependent protease
VKNRTLFFALSALGLTLGSVPLAGCSYIRAHQAKAAYAEYQESIAAGDMPRARRALIKLVRADEDVSAYWVELGKLQIQMGDYRGAYDAFSHAHELDRSNVPVLAALTQIALLAGNTDVAYDHARSLALVSPDNPVVTLVNGTVAFKSREFDKANAAADKILTATPDDTFGKILKARVMIATNKMDEAVALLEGQHRAVPEDTAAIRALSDLYRLRGEWRKLAQVQLDLHRLSPKDTSISLAVVEALLRAGDIPAAGKMSAPLVSASASPQLVDETLALWARTQKDQMLPDAHALAEHVDRERQVSFGNYFNQVGHPELAQALLGNRQLPVNHKNARSNAVIAQSMFLQGQAADAKTLFDQVLDEEPDQVEALRGRSALLAKTGQAKAAVIDALRLVTISPKVGEDRLVLAQAYLADGNRKEVRRALWQAFQELPGDDRVATALKNVLASAGDQEGLRRVDEEVADRRLAKLTKELIS